MFSAHLLKILKMMAENEHAITIDSTEYESHVWKIQSVFKLPPHITSLDTYAFKPNVISFGPYHYNEQHLKPMEAHKLRSFIHFLNFTNTTSATQHLLQSFKPIEQELMKHYDQLDDKWRDGDCFLELMIRDGCFMLDILLRREELEMGHRDDPVFGQSFHSDFMRKNIKRDMLLIENQLPLLVLKKLIADNKVVLEKLKAKYVWDWRKVKEGHMTEVKLEVENIEDSKEEEGDMTEEEFIHKQIHHLILNFFEISEVNIRRDDLCLHAQDVLRESMIQKEAKQVETEADERPVSRTSPSKIFPPATKLRNIGVDIRATVSTCLMDITFENQFLILPHICIDRETKATFLNLMAFENFQACKGREVSTYINFMASLIRSAKDVRLLRSREVIETTRESDEAIAALFHELAESPLGYTDDSLDGVFEEFSDHFRGYDGLCKVMLGLCGFCCRMWRFDFQDTYCKTPWRFISVVAGIILLILTVTQTTYTVLPYYTK